MQKTLFYCVKSEIASQNQIQNVSLTVLDFLYFECHEECTFFCSKVCISQQQDCNLQTGIESLRQCIALNGLALYICAQKTWLIVDVFFRLSSLTRVFINRSRYLKINRLLSLMIIIHRNSQVSTKRPKFVLIYLFLLEISVIFI